MSEPKTWCAPEDVEREVRQFLEAMNRGERMVTSVSLLRESRSHRAFEFSNGWRMVVFDDCGDFDYIDRLETPRGVLYGFPLEKKEQVPGSYYCPCLQNYRPPDDVLDRVFRWREPIRCESK